MLLSRRGCTTTGSHLLPVGFIHKSKRFFINSFDHIIPFQPLWNRYEKRAKEVFVPTLLRVVLAVMDFDSIWRLIVCFGEKRGHMLLVNLVLNVLRQVFYLPCAIVIRNERTHLPLCVVKNVNDGALFEGS